MTPAAFFARANELMLTNPPAEADAEKLARIAAVNVGPGMTFDMIVLNEDGTLDIIVSAAEPEQLGNWLPVNEDDFHLYMRIYTPDMESIETWTAPVITMIR